MKQRLKVSTKRLLPRKKQVKPIKALSRGVKRKKRFRNLSTLIHKSLSLDVYTTIDQSTLSLSHSLIWSTITSSLKKKNNLELCMRIIPTKAVKLKL
jgi:hypothetical protein